LAAELVVEFELRATDKGWRARNLRLGKRRGWRLSLDWLRAISHGHHSIPSDQRGLLPVESRGVVLPVSQSTFILARRAIAHKVQKGHLLGNRVGS